MPARFLDTNIPVRYFTGDDQRKADAAFALLLRLFVQYPLSFADAFNIAYMQSHQLTEIYSWDKDFDRVPGITRLEP
jgi:predicted nucleic acid-binding protein